MTIAVTLHDAENNPAVRFAPAKNITAYELALVTNLFLKMSTGTDLRAEWPAYLAEHKLERHFEAIDG